FAVKGAGLYSLKASGTIIIKSKTADRLTTGLDLVILVAMSPFREPTPIEVKIKDERMFTRIGLDDLTPWLGTCQSELGKEVYPGLVVTVPAGTTIVGPDGNPVSQITITPVPVDRSPMPFPAGVTASMLFTIQPGGAVPSQPLPITFPNVRNAPPGSQADLYFFDLSIGGWAVWGTGTVSDDGSVIVSNPGFGLPRFAWHYPYTPNSGDLPDQCQ